LENSANVKWGIPPIIGGETPPTIISGGTPPTISGGRDSLII
jgi:hypothetical protein